MNSITAIMEAHDIKKTCILGKILVPALQGVSLSIEQGEFLAILGPSGSGKSTLLQILGCLSRPDTGNVYFEGNDVLKMNSDRLAELRLKKIGFVFQFFNLLPRLSALKNVELPLALAGLSDKESRKKAHEMLALVGLSQRANHRPYEMSGGEQQRVAIARALVNDPKIIFADEPTGNLDTATGTEILQLMRRLNEEEGQTCVIITHDTSVADISDHLVYISDGLIMSSRKIERSA